MKYFLTIFCFLAFQQWAACQKLVRKTIINPEKQYVQINTENCYLLALQTTTGKELVVEAEIEGEYKKDLAINIEEDGNTIVVGASFLPNFRHPNDKLSAHKVISIALKISVPEYSQVNVLGTNTKVNAQGNYEKLKIVLGNGDCVLYGVKENIEVKTQKGNIILLTEEGDVKAKSTYGKVTLAPLPTGNTTFILTSIEGDIKVTNPK